ncbi:unnamed protein product [Tuber melanosporum]|uniref:(Perigord truffle) hypothetical protein n=1 Tax=Tuber melanosporum (strain Mel28) TaxID=656061 RepID=D5GJN5_TUBMM|nr:uncharacterized protein GSTUM_00009087001 [Tuber melanosporum]CAZ84728.1 unnamed protein product [Tuber melanosporum]
MAKRVRSDSVSSATSPSWTIFTRPVDQEDTVSQDLSSKSSYSKHVCLDPLSSEQTPSISCFLPPGCSGEPFASHEQFETHYIQAHSNRCHECGRNFPSLRFLDLHIAENHDPLTELKRERGDKTYACFVEGCSRLCSSPQKRRMHLIDKHHFPKEYNWNIVKWGIDQCTSLLSRKRSLPQTFTEGETLTAGGRDRFRSANVHKGETKRPPKANGKPVAATGATVDETYQQVQKGEGSKNIQKAKNEEIDMDDIAFTMSSLKIVPTSIRFGRRGGGHRR